MTTAPIKSEDKRKVSYFFEFSKPETKEERFNFIKKLEAELNGKRIDEKNLALLEEKAKRYDQIRERRRINAQKSENVAKLRAYNQREDVKEKKRLRYAVNKEKYAQINKTNRRIFATIKKEYPDIIEKCAKKIETVN